MRALIRRFWWAPVLLLLLAAGGFVAWAVVILAPMPEAMAALVSDARVTVESDRWIVFAPAGREPDTGFIFYPGGRVDAPYARAIAAAGFRVVITPMPLNLAVFAPDSARAVISAYLQVTQWAVGGHSLGGSMAAAFAQQNPSAMQGLVLWASYPAESNSLATSSLRVVSLSGTRDGLSTPAKIEASRQLLPPATTFFAIGGGNHAQFGWYGPQDGDNPATISREDQRARVVEETVDALSMLVPPPSARCAPRRDDPTGYLVKICDYVVKRGLNLAPGSPEQLAIREIGQGTYQGRAVVVVYLRCCYTGDRAFIDPQSGAVVGCSLGAK